MMVEEENYSTGQFSTHGRNVGVLRVQRAKNGRWHMLIEVDIEVKVLDGRIVRAQQRASVPATAQHKKRQNPVWLHKPKP